MAQYNYLLSSIGYDYRIRKNPTYVEDNFKHYFYEHTRELLELVKLLDEYNLYDSVWKEYKINNGNIEYDINYSLEDSYNAIINNVIYSGTEYDVIKYHIEHIDTIINAISKNIDEVLTFPLSRSLIHILNN